MRLPNGVHATIDDEKLRGYLLSRSHPVGRFKAAFLGRLGFSERDWRELGRQLRLIAATGEAEAVPANEFGRKFLVSGVLAGPTGRSTRVTTVWIVPVGDDTPHLVTVYPG